MAPCEEKELRSVGIQDAEQSPARTNRPQELLWFTWAPSIRRALARSPSLLLHCQQLEQCLVSAGQLCHTRIFFFGNKFKWLPPLTFNVVLQQGLGKVDRSSGAAERKSWSAFPFPFRSECNFYFLCSCFYSLSFIFFPGTLIPGYVIS